jgi:hypothetical protein
MYSKRRGFTAPVLVTTKKSTSNGLFFPITAPMDASECPLVRPAIDLSNISADVSVQVGWQLSVDGETWPLSTDTPGLFNSGTLAAQTTETVAYATIFENIVSALTKKNVRFGVWVKNGSTNVLETALVAIRLEFKKC